MAETVEFKVKLDDEVSKPARRGAASVDKLADQVDRLRGTAGKVGGAVNKMRMGQMNRQLGQTRTAAGGAAAGIGRMVGQLLPIAALAAVGIRALQALGRAAVGAGLAIAEATLYAENMRFSLSKFLGSAQAGQREMFKLLDVSDQLGVSFRDAAGTFKSFVSAGLVADAAHEMVKFRADLEAVANTEKDIERLNDAFMQIEKAIATGRLEMDGFTSILAGLPGVTEETIFAQLGPMMGKTVDELKKMEKTKLPIDKLMEAIKLAFLKATGATELGTLAMEKQLSTVSGAFQAFKNIAGNALIRLGAEVGPQLKEVLLPAFTELMEAMRSKDGAAALRALAKVIATLVKLGVSFAKGFAKGFKVALPGIKALASAIGKLLGTSEGMSAMETVVTALGWAIGVVAGALAGFVGSILLVVSAFAGIPSAVQSAITALEELPGKLGGVAGEAFGGGTSIGSAIVMGIVQGLTLGMGSVIIAIVDLVSKAYAAGKAAIGSSSPSKLFEQLFATVPAGAERGIEGGAPAVSSAAAGMIDPAKMGGGGVNVSAPMRATFNVSGAADPHETAAVIAKTLEAKVAGMFETVAIQVGVTGG